MKCLNTIIYYDNPEEVKSYISEVNAIADNSVDIILIVNSNNKKELNKLIEELKYNNITVLDVIDYKENVGYLNALLKTILKINVDSYDYFILSNTDIHYDKNFFYRLSHKKYSKDIGCIAPCVFASRSNSYSNPHYLFRIPRKKLERLAILFGFPLLGKIYLKFAEIKAHNKKNKKQASCYVYSPHGCYMIFTKSFIKKIKGYVYGVKMYSEESAIGELLLRNGYKCYYDSNIKVVHQESTVTGKVNYKNRFQLWKTSLEYILNEFY